MKDEQLAKSLSPRPATAWNRSPRACSAGKASAGKLLTDQQLYDRFNSLARRIEKLAANLEQGQGSAGQFLQNKQLYENMNGAASELKALIAEIRKDPKKYLNVRVSIFLRLGEHNMARDDDGAAGNGRHGVRARGGHRRGGGAADGAGHRRRDAAGAGGQSARRARARERSRPAGARVREPAEGNAVARPSIAAARRTSRRAPASRVRRPAVETPVTSGWSDVFLGVIAVATLVMALIQIGAIIAALRLARQAQEMIQSVQRDVRPLIAKANAIAEEASRTVALATAQAQKVDRLVTDLSRRVDETAGVLQQAIVTPAREGLAIVAALKAGLGALRGLRELQPRHGRQADEEDPLFIG